MRAKIASLPKLLQADCRHQFVVFVPTHTTTLHPSWNPLLSSLLTIIMDSSLICHFIGCTALGFFCIPCKKALSKKNIRHHLLSHHKDNFQTMPAANIRSVMAALAKAAPKSVQDSCLVGKVKTSYQCSVCNTFYIRKDNFRPHASTGQCQGSPTVVSYQDTTCGRHHILKLPSGFAAPASQPVSFCCPPQTQLTLVQHTCEWAMAPGPITMHT